MRELNAIELTEVAGGGCCTNGADQTCNCTSQFNDCAVVLYNNGSNSGVNYTTGNCGYYIGGQSFGTVPGCLQN